MENIKSVKANMIYISIKSLPHRAFVFWGNNLWIFFFIFEISMATNTNGYENVFGKNYSRNIFYRISSKYLQRLGSKCHFSILPL